MDNKQKGNLAVASAIAYFVSSGYMVSIPLSDTAKYDLVIEKQGAFQAVQCKYAGYERSAGIFAVPLYVSGGNRSAGNHRIRYQSGDFDVLYILCANQRAYAIPFGEIADQITINVGRGSKWSKWEKYLLLSAGDNCSPVEESAGENFPNSVKPSGDGNAEPVPIRDGVET
jgi:hypothetical protein